MFANGAGYQFGFFAVTAFLLLAAAIRWARTPPTHAEYRARGDMARLMAVVLIGQVGALARARFVPGSIRFWVCTVLLVPVAAAALFLVRRLLKAYRGETS